MVLPMACRAPKIMVTIHLFVDGLGVLFQKGPSRLEKDVERFFQDVLSFDDVFEMKIVVVPLCKSITPFPPAVGETWHCQLSTCFFALEVFSTSCGHSLQWLTWSVISYAAGTPMCCVGSYHISQVFIRLYKATQMSWGLHL